MGRPMRALPVELAGTPWPEVPSPDQFGEIARQFVLNVRDAMAGRSLRSVAADAGIGHVTLQRVLAGQAWPDLATIARLEVGLDAALWPRRPAS
ncbi:helix-turn-helix transcriptional regulator [Curtobacterium sp. MCBA15_013]|uniref:helix-turn-helix transcriptional regulator n=1 Tax=Curtobacterium sp. MCBA15_013 TaxID=1898739 RepID=UPI00111350C7|nr:helix-turn-helix transcriptional regulator [Curtobacterium sp. MCBA15_013]